MIKVVDGDLMYATEDIIAHQVNCQAKMNSGVAKAIREKFPQAYEQYMIQFNLPDKDKLLGACHLVYIKSHKKYVANLFAQLNYGYDGEKYTDEGALKKSLLSLKSVASRYNLSVALPYKIGSDRGGADWNEVYKIIEEVFLDYEVTLYKLPKGE